jgi:DNA repair protein SbcD/Mre11
MALKLLAVGDLHLGRSPTRLPESLVPRARELGPAGAWRRIVGHAIAERVDVLVLAGDVVEQEDDYFEAYRSLASGVRDLLDANVRVLGVAGNHDVKVLPRLADQIAGFHLLGRGGQWEQVTLDAGGQRLVLHGWSFPQQVVRDSPVADLRTDREAARQGADGVRAVHLGLLHCDLDQRGSRYAPVTTAELEATGLDGWLLGHIHAPGQLSAQRLFGYLGSATGLDPGEAGARGPWCIRIADGRIATVEQRTLAPLHWAPLPVDLSGIDEPEAARDRLLQAVQALDRQLAAHTDSPHAAGLRVTMTGRTRFAADVQALFAGEWQDELYSGDRGTHYFVERLRHETLPEIDLADLARQSDPPGLLAQRLLALDDGPGVAGCDELVRRARRQLEARARLPQWAALREPAGSDAQSAAELLHDEAIVAWLRESGLAALSALLSQRQGQE